MPKTRILFPFILLALCMLPMSACQQTSPVELPPLSFKQYLPIHMAVSNIEIIEEYKPPMTLPNVEHLIPYSPTEAMEIWSRQRLRAVGLENNLQIIIKDASVTVNQLPFERDWTSFFSGQPDKRYDAKLEVELRVYGSHSAMSLANVKAKATRSIIINDNVTLLERDARLRALIKDLMTLINATLEENMFRYMSNYISFSQNP